MVPYESCKYSMIIVISIYYIYLYIHIYTHRHKIYSKLHVGVDMFLGGGSCLFPFNVMFEPFYHEISANVKESVFVGRFSSHGRVANES